MIKKENKEAWIVTVDMGYGHQRASYPLRHLSSTNKVISANNYQGIPKKDKAVWENSRRLYEFVSRLTALPLIGKKIFNIYDKFQAIPEFYPKRDLSKSTFQIRQMYRLIKNGWGKHLVEYLNTKPGLPLITTFFIPAFMAEEHGFKNDIYCILTDADVSRTWAGLNPKQTRIKFLAPCRRVVARLKLYGVPKENIFLTGFPLPEENLGGQQLLIAKADLAERIINLDPEHHYRTKYDSTIKQFLDHYYKIDVSHHEHPLTLTFAVGGAGAQRELGRKIIISLKDKLLKNKINLNLVAGSRNDVYIYFCKEINNLGLKKLLSKNLNIIFAVEKEDYFREFNKVLRKTDILWTKPSELSFYTALGIPIIMAPTIGSQEKFNKDWLTGVGGGLLQEDPQFTHEWLFDWVDSGWFAEAAMSGFLDGRQFGVHNIKKVVFEGVKEPAKNYQLL